MTSGVFPKADGELASADQIMNNLGGQQFKNFSQLLFNSARIGFNVGLNVTTGAS